MSDRLIAGCLADVIFVQYVFYDSELVEIYLCLLRIVFVIHHLLMRTLLSLDTLNKKCSIFFMINKKNFASGNYSIYLHISLLNVE